MKIANELEFLRLISTITHDAITNKAPGYQSLIETATQQASSEVPAYLATFRYLHSHLNALLIEASSDNN